jgi:hypothetical protein
MRAPCGIVLAAAAVTLLAAGCGDKQGGGATTVPSPARVNKNPAVYARRTVDLFLRDLTRDLNVLNSVNAPEIRIYLANGNKDTIRILDRAMHDLHVCTGKLDNVGAPPPGNKPLEAIDLKLRAACRSYEQISDVVLRAAPYLEQGDQSAQEKGVKILHQATPLTQQAAKDFSAALKLMEKRPEFRAAGLQGAG